MLDSWSEMRLYCLLVAASALGCTFDELDHIGKTCPCATGFSCDLVSNTCVDNTHGCVPLVAAKKFRIEWTTPNSIAFRWDSAGDGSSFAGYRLHYGPGDGPGPGSDELELGSGENPELGLWEAPYTGDPFPIQSTIVRKLEPETLYWARLEVRDAEGCSFETPVVSTTTSVNPPSDQVGVVVFDDAISGGGWTLPDTVQEVQNSALAYEGTTYLQWIVDTTSGENVQIGGFDLPLDQVGKNLERSAFIEFAVSLEQDSNSYYTRINFEGTETAYRSSRIEGFTVRADGEYQLYQFPIQALAMDDGGPLFATQAHFQKFSFGCSPFIVGGVIRLDSIRLRW